MVLKTKVKQLEDNKVELTVEVEAVEVDKKINAAYKQASKARIPGFRPGKAPRKVLENNFGGKEYFQVSATEELVREKMPLAVDEEGYVPLKEPEVEKIDLVEEGQPYTFVFTVEITPHLTLSSYEPVKMELPSTEPLEEEIEEQVTALREYYVEHEPVRDRGAQEGDMLVIYVGDEMEIISDAPSSDKDEEPNEMLYEIGSHTMPDEFENGLVGMKVGDTKEIEINADSETQESMTVKVTIRALNQKILPELTDEWVKETLEYEDVADLKTRIADSIRESKSANLPPLKELFASERIAERLQGEPPEEMIKEIEQSNYQDFFKSLQERRLTLDQYLQSNDMTSEGFRDQMRETAVKNASAALALDALARHLNLTASDDEVFEEFKRAGLDDPEKMYKEWQRQGRISEIRQGLLRMKAARHLHDTAEIYDLGTMPKEEEPVEESAAPKKKAAKTAPSKRADAKDEGEKKSTATAAPKTASKTASKSTAKTASTARKPAAKKTTAARESTEEPAKKTATRKPAAKKTSENNESAAPKAEEA